MFLAGDKHLGRSFSILEVVLFDRRVARSPLYIAFKMSDYSDPTKPEGIWSIVLWGMLVKPAK